MTYYEIAIDAHGRVDLRTGQLKHRRALQPRLGVLRIRHYRSPGPRQVVSYRQPWCVAEHLTLLV
jgi:hypothetical protein